MVDRCDGGQHQQHVLGLSHHCTRSSLLDSSLIVKPQAKHFVIVAAEEDNVAQCQTTQLFYNHAEIMTHPEVIERIKLLVWWCHRHPLHISPQLCRLIDEFARWTPVTDNIIHKLVDHVAFLHALQLNCVDVRKTSALRTLWAYGPMQQWDTSQVTSMAELFMRRTYDVAPKQELFRDNNIHLGHWDTSAVTDMSFMFSNSVYFNVDISRWNTSSVTTMEFMFCGCDIFNQPIGNWDVSNVKCMQCTLFNCGRFNQPLQSWNVSNVDTMNSMFYHCRRFNQPLAEWDVRNVRDMQNMFDGCNHFDQCVDRWSIDETVVNTCNMFWDCPSWIRK